MPNVWRYTPKGYWWVSTGFRRAQSTSSTTGWDGTTPLCRKQPQAQKRGDSLSAAPWNDGKQSFSTKERLAGSTKDV
jgi:hypothetical protein